MSLWWGEGGSWISWGGLFERGPSFACKSFAFFTPYIWQSNPFQAYRHIFTSPSSASKENAATVEITSRQRDVASTLRLNGHVTPRSIVYTATQVCICPIVRTIFQHFFPQLVFSLNSAPLWRPEHAGFHYPSFYYFIVNFFENDPDDKSLGNLLQWWNTYVQSCLYLGWYPNTCNLSSNIFPPAVSNTGGAASRNAMRSSQKRLKEAQERHAHM